MDPAASVWPKPLAQRLNRMLEQVICNQRQVQAGVITYAADVR